MAYVSEFQHDVFISYAVLDNDGPYGEKRGWVQAFEERLKALIKREVGQRGTVVDVWLDRKRLACGDAFVDEIRDALESTAVLVVLLSKQYFASEYCRLERETFLQAIAQQQNAEKRVFIVELTDPQEFPGAVPTNSPEFIMCGCGNGRAACRHGWVTPCPTLRSWNTRVSTTVHGKLPTRSQSG